MSKEKLLLDRLNKYLKIDDWYTGPFFNKEDVQILAVALAKRIPQPPTAEKGWIYYCPICGDEFSYNYDYCPHCGQAIDWSEV